jgi:hypothetical protein
MRKQLKKFFLDNREPVLVVYAIVFLAQFLISRTVSDFRIIFFIIPWLLFLRLCKFDARFSVGGGLALLSLCPLLLILGKGQFAVKSAIWAYVFLLVGMIQIFIGYLKEDGRKKQSETEKLEN